MIDTGAPLYFDGPPPDPDDAEWAATIAEIEAEHGPIPTIPGGATALDEPAPERSPLEILRSELLIGDAIKAIPPPEPLVHGLLDLNTLAALYGPPGAGKSAIALSIGFSVATGAWWHGREVTKGPVVYIAAEGVAGQGQRLDALETHHQIYGDPTGLIWLPRAVNLRSTKWLPPLVEVLAELDPSLVIIDTLSRSMVGSDENSSKDMGEAVEAAEQIRRATGACVLIIHHVPKSGGDLRGHGSLLGALDSAISVVAAESVLSIEVTKTKNHAPPAPFRLKLHPVGDAFVAVPYGGDGPLDGASVPANGVAMLTALHEVDTGSGISRSMWMKAADGVAERTFHRWVKRLLEAGFCQSAASNGKGPYSLTALGSEIVTATALPSTDTTVSPAGSATAATATSLKDVAGGSNPAERETEERF